MEEELKSLIYNRVSDLRIRDCIDILPDAEHTLEKYLHLGETQELSDANAAAFNPQPSTASVHALGYKGKSLGKRTGKPIEVKCKLDTGASVNVMPLAAYKLINPSEFDKDNKPTGGFGQDRDHPKRIQWYYNKAVWNKD